MRHLHLVSDEAGTPIGSVRELISYFEAGEKPRERWRVGTEHEMCGVYRADGTPPPYEGERGISAILAVLGEVGWEAVRENGHTIALARGDSQVTIEPGGQLEHAARPVFAASELASDLKGYVSEVCAPSKSFGIAWLAMGFRPFGTRDDVPWMPKQRYDIMREYLPTKGGLALDMMKRTATVQVNLDYLDADDAKAKLRAIMSVTPVLTALYASSPIVGGKDSGFQSYRAEVWRDTDPDRCGLLPFAFDDGNVFETYTEWALDVPMFFVHRGSYRPANGMTFRQFLENGFEGERATLDDWELHLSTLFPDARLKKYIEVRGCDASTVPMILGLGPLCRGLLYSDDALRASTALTEGLSLSQRMELQRDVPREGLAARVPGQKTTVGDLARELVAIASRSLEGMDATELPFLEPIEQVARTGRTRSDDIRQIWSQGTGDIAATIAALSYPEFDSCK